MSRNEDLQKRRDAAIARGIANQLPVFVERARNAELWDVEGRRYIDFAAGIAVVNTGHVHPAVQAAAAKQLEAFTHTCFMVTPYEVAVELAERLNRLAPGPTPKKSIFVTTGAEAVENAIKIARAHTGRSGVIAFGGGFHGRTFMAMALTGKVAPYKAAFGPFPAEIYHAPFPIAYHGVSVADSLAAIEHIFKYDIEPARVAAIIIEPVMGEGGFYIAPPEFLQALRKLCDQHGIVLVIDEIQTGFARTGRMFAVEYAGIEPDLMTLAKSLAGGFPLAAVVGKAAIMDAPAPGGLGGTYAGSPVACAAGLAVLDAIEKEKLCGAPSRSAQRWCRHCARRRRRFPRSARCATSARWSRWSSSRTATRISRMPSSPRRSSSTRRRRGWSSCPAGFYGNVIRFLAPLTASDEIVREGMGVALSALRELTEAPVRSAVNA